MFLGWTTQKLYLLQGHPDGLRNLSWETTGETLLLRQQVAVLSLQVAVSSLELYCFSKIICDCCLAVISI